MKLSIVMKNMIGTDEESKNYSVTLLKLEITEGIQTFNDITMKI